MTSPPSVEKIPVSASPLRRALAFAVIIQSIGAGLAILTVLGISRWLGSVAQGHFAIYKNWYEITTLALLFGTPQGIVYAINRDFVTPAFAMRIAVWLSLVAVPVLFLLAIVEAPIGYLPQNDGFVSAVLIALGCAGYVFHGLARSILLTRRDGVLFSLVSVAPTAGIALVIFVMTFIDRVNIGLAFAINGMGCALLGLLAIQGVEASDRKPRAGWRTVLFRQSAHFLVQSLLLAGQPLIVFAFLQFGAGVTAVGVFSFALVGLVAINALIGMVAPILYSRWSRAARARVLSHVNGIIARVALVAGIALSMGMYVFSHMTGLFGGAEFADAGSVVAILALGCVPLVFTRLAQPALAASGRTEVGTLIGVLRFGSIVAILLASLLWDWDGITVAAVGWTISEWLAAGALGLLLNRGGYEETECSDPTLSNLSEP